MKPIIKREEQNVILTSEITEDHIVVGIVNGHPAIMCGHEYGNEILKFLSIKNISQGAFFGYSCNSISQLAEKYINHKQSTIEVFHKQDWKQALQWLIDNAE